MPILITLLSTISHYYNYAAFGLAASFLAEDFLPTTKFGIVYLFSALGLAVLVRPLASIIFGTIGDVYGRSSALKLTSFFSAIAMILVCLMPKFEKIGYFAVVTLIVSRIFVLASAIMSFLINLCMITTNHPMMLVSSSAVLVWAIVGNIQVQLGERKRLKFNIFFFYDDSRCLQHVSVLRLAAGDVKR